MIRDLNVFESSFDVVFLYALNFDMIKDVLMCNFYYFKWDKNLSKICKICFLRFFLLKYLGNLFSLEYEGHIKIKR